MDNRLYFGVRSVERQARRQRRRLVGGAHTLSCEMKAVWQGEEHTHLLLALTRFVWAGSVWQLAATSRSVPSGKRQEEVLFGVLANVPTLSRTYSSGNV